MNIWQGKRYWLIGASEGLGRELALCLSRAGAEVIVSARSAARLEALVGEMPGKATALPLDVADRAAVTEAAAKITNDLGQIDGLIYFAAVCWPMTAQNWDEDKVEAMAQVNYLGASRAIGAVIGPMVARDAGHIVLAGSLTGFRGRPGAIGYGASKAGVMHLAETMQADLRGTGIKVQIINPGFIKSRQTDPTLAPVPFSMTAESAAREIFEHMNTDAFKRSFPLLVSWLVRIGQFLPDWAYFRLFARR